ncbi:unnamed protein product [Pleuronectes platessa]|uniref:Uncharacterized protein n=1 Tax=Pleuronectes platessa TaxID=8262 RepID=A0A9N7YNN9_PLEPL|nr:unnamed protein product [Pleuronectes platessa]
MDWICDKSTREVRGHNSKWRLRRGRPIRRSAAELEMEGRAANTLCCLRHRGESGILSPSADGAPCPPGASQVWGNMVLRDEAPSAGGVFSGGERCLVARTLLMEEKSVMSPSSRAGGDRWSCTFEAGPQIPPDPAEQTADTRFQAWFLLWKGGTRERDGHWLRTGLQKERDAPSPSPPLPPPAATERMGFNKDLSRHPPTMTALQPPSQTSAQLAGAIPWVVPSAEWSIGYKQVGSRHRGVETTTT